MRPQTIFVSATPGNWELEQTQGVFTEQIIRPTGLLDPICEVRPIATQVDDLLAEALEDMSVKKKKTLLNLALILRDYIPD